MKLSKLLFFLLTYLVCQSTFAAAVDKTIYINRGVLTTVDLATMPYLAFNSTTTFDQENTRILLEQNDVLTLTIVNTDSISHSFDVTEYSGALTTIAANSSAQVVLTFSQVGAYIYFDPSASFAYLGLSGLIAVKNTSVNSSDFYWNIKEHQSSFNDDLNQGIPVDWSSYYPTYFTINGKSNPAINADAAARVTGNVGDTIHIYMANTGQSIHSIHFHGYHSKIICSTKFPDHVGRLKDTFPIYSMESVILELVPDKVGEYPVHDHNLVAVSGANMYPNGMFLTLLID